MDKDNRPHSREKKIGGGFANVEKKRRISGGDGPAGFGVPTLGSALPGMSYTIGAKGAGVCCDMDEQSIVSAADELVLNWGSYSKRAGEFFDSVDIKKIVQEILEEVIG